MSALKDKYDWNSVKKDRVIVLEKDKKTRKRERVCRVFVSLSVSAALLAIVWCRTCIYFETNDDRYIASILSGAVTGSPDAHVIYMNYLLSLPLSLLYRFTVEVPWYGGMLVLFLWLFWGAVLDSAYTRCRKWTQAFLVTMAAAGVFFAYYYCAGMIQYTSLAAFLAIGGYVCLLLRQNKKSGFVCFIALELLSCLLRSQAMLMIQPMGMAAVVVAMAEDRKKDWKARGRAFFAVAAAAVLVLGVSKAGDFIGYHGEAWERYWQFNDTRTAMFDFYRTPEYEEISFILEKSGVSREKYEAYRAYMILDWKIDGATEETLRDYIVNSRKKTFQPGDLLEIGKISIWGLPWRVQLVTLIAWGIFLLWGLLGKRWRTLFYGVIFLGGSRMALWSYLVWRERVPLRVTLPLLACEVFFLLALVWLNWIKIEFVAWKKTFLFMGCLLFFLSCLYTGGKQSRYVGEVIGNKKIFMKGLDEIRAYCDGCPENRYLLDANTMSYYTGSVFDTGQYRPINAVLGGGWFSTSPSVQRRLEEYLGGAPGFYFLIISDGNEENTPEFVYLTDVMGGKPKLADQWTASHGGTYNVYYFEGAFPFS